MTSEFITVETPPSSDAALLARLQSRSDDRLAWEAGIEVFRRAGTGAPVTLPDGWRSHRPEVTAVLEAADERRRAASPHWPLSCLLADSREYVRSGAIDLIGELCKDESQSTGSRRAAADRLLEVAEGPAGSSRERAIKLLVNVRPYAGAQHAARLFKAKTGRSRWVWGYILGFGAMGQLGMGLLRVFEGQADQFWSFLVIALIFGVSAVLLIRSSAFLSRRHEFIGSLDLLEKAVAIDPTGAFEALPDLDALAQIKTNTDISSRSAQLASKIRTAIQSDLPITVGSASNEGEMLPRPAHPPD